MNDKTSSFSIAADFRKGEKTREEITDLMAGGASIATLESEIEGYMDSLDGHPPQRGLQSTPTVSLSPGTQNWSGPG